MFRAGFRPFFLLTSLAVFFACHLTQSGKAEPEFDFPTLKAVIGDADHATILLKDSAGTLIDTLFHGAVTASTTFKGLPAPDYDGGRATISIEARKKGEVVYKVERGYDGKAGGNVGTSIIQVSPATTLDIEWLLPKVREGDSVSHPPVKILPTALLDKNLAWISRQPHLLSVSDTHLKAHAPGTAVLVVILRSDTAKKDSIAVEILARNASGDALDSLRLSPDLLTLALRGPHGHFTLTVHPSTASQEVVWKSLDSSQVKVALDGTLTPVAVGTARIVAIALADPTRSDTAQVEVLGPLKVDSVRLDKDSLELFANGAAEALTAKVHPQLANPKVLFHSRDSALVQVLGTQVRGVKEGETFVYARSQEDEGKTDSLKVIVFPSQKVDSVKVAPDTLRLFVNGESQNLKASIHPVTLQGRFTWRSGDAKVATVDGAGKVSPAGEGKTYVSARARADSTRKDSSLILVKKDTPRLRVGADTVISAGTIVTFHPEALQDYGLVVLFKWDLNGDGTYEDSTTALKSPLTQHYAEAKEYGARFYARDTEGNDTVVIRKVKAVTGRVVQITSPKDGAYVNTTPITVTWMVDGSPQSNSQALNPGANTVTRSASDSSGKAFSHSITVHLDQTAPGRPIVRGPTAPVNTLTPEWRWTSGGGGGNGLYRYRLGDPDLSAQAALPDTFFTAPSNLSGGTHTLYVQERDEAGNWSANGSFAIRIDTTAPPAPTVSVTPSSPSNHARPTWTWSGGVGDAYRFYRYKLNNDDFRSGAKDTTGMSFTPSANLSDTVHTLYVQVRDSAGNWSETASRSITIDTQRPTAPVVTVAPAPLTNDDTPTWSWPAVPGATGYRFKVNDSNLETGATETAQLSHTPASGLGEGAFTLYVQARDAAGNWSLRGSRQVRIDLTPPTPPRIDSTPYSPLNTLRPRWTWRSGTGGAKVFRARVDNPDLSTQPEQTDSNFVPGTNLQEGRRTLYVQERDSAGNWSIVEFRQIFLALRGMVGGQPVTSEPCIASYMGIGINGTPFFSFAGPYAANFKGVMHFDGNSWKTLGGVNPFPMAVVLDPKMEISSLSGYPYISYFDDSIIVKYFNGSTWESFPSAPNNSAEVVREFAMTTTKEGRPLIAYSRDQGVVDGYYILLRKFTGVSWTNEYPTDFSETDYRITQLVLDTTNSVPYVVFTEPNGKMKIKTYRNSSWSYLSNSGLPDVDHGFSKLRINKTGIPFLALRDGTSGLKDPLILVTC